MLGHAHPALRWGQRKFASVAKSPRLESVSTRTTIMVGAVDRYAESSCPVVSISASNLVTRASAVPVKYVLRHVAIAVRSKR